MESNKAQLFPILGNQVVVTAQSKILQPLRCGHCFMDFIQGDYSTNIDNFDNAKITYNKRLQHIHIECGGDLTYESESLTYINEMKECLESKTYRMYLEHSDTCPNRIYRMICQTENV